ncbi:hypothetical protein ACP26L_23535 [Paenibacillus sp. S-38]|uniref:hypothetical protein n=1 Tax=Paenibacillus sp. S-38 TaxID=3416710 RepID=UPI003CEEAE9A
MTTIGTLLAIVMAGAFAFFLGPVGGLALLSAIFGLTLSTYLRNKAIQADLQEIKKHLGLDKEEERSFQLSNEEIEQELFRLHGEGKPGERTSRDLEIERELTDFPFDEDDKPGDKR